MSERGRNRATKHTVFFSHYCKPWTGEKETDFTINAMPMVTRHKLILSSLLPATSRLTPILSPAFDDNIEKCTKNLVLYAFRQV